MRRDAVLLMITALLLVIESVVSIHPLIRIDVATLVVVYLTLERAVVPGAVCALIIGYLNDLYGGSSHGLYASSMVMVFFLMRLLVARMLGEGLLFITGVSIFSTALTIFVTLGVERVMGPGAATLDAISPALPSLLMSAAVLGYPVYRLMKTIDERFTVPEDDFATRRS